MLLLRLLVLGVVWLVCTPVMAETYYVPHVTSLLQSKITSPIPGNNTEVYEGCGPISAAMLLGFWQTEKGKTNLLDKDFFGRSHPKKAVRKLYRRLNTMKGPGTNNLASFTRAKDFYDGLEDWVKGSGLKVERVRRVKTWAAKEAALKTQLKKGHPVVLLKWKEHKDGCLGEGTRGYNIYKNLKYSHYFLAVGYRGNKVAVMPGFRFDAKQSSSGFGVHLPRNQNKPELADAHAICTFDEIRKISPTLFWLEPKN